MPSSPLQALLTRATLPHKRALGLLHIPLNCNPQFTELSTLLTGSHMAMCMCPSMVCTIRVKTMKRQGARAHAQGVWAPRLQPSWARWR